MFTIADGRDALYQWDSDVKLIVNDPNGKLCAVHFSSCFSDEVLTVKVQRDEDKASVMVPNILLQKSLDIFVYCATEHCTLGGKIIKVIARPKPSDYIYTETEVLTVQKLDERVNQFISDVEAAMDEGRFNGKTAYQYAQDGGYTGTEEEFAKKMAQEAEWMATKELAGGDTIYIPEQNLSKSIWKNLKLSLQTGCFYDVTLNGEVYSCEALTDDGSVILGNNPSLTLNDYPFCISWAGGTATMGMFFKRSDISYPVTLKVTDHVDYVYNQMPESYLPESVESVIVRSSTDGSTKKFKLTVDDTGTIKATEVT